MPTKKKTGVLPGTRIALFRVPSLNEKGISALLLENSLPYVSCQSFGELCLLFEEGVGAIILSEEEILSEEVTLFLSRVKDQPAWSEIPMLVLYSRQEALEYIITLCPSAIILDVAAPAHSLLSILLSTLRLRQKQYEVHQHVYRELESQGELRRKEERLELALQIGEMGSWDHNVKTGQIIWSEGTERLFGIPAGSYEGTFEGFLNRIHPEDQEYIIAAVEERLREGEDYKVEFRIVRPDGTIRWLDARAQILRDGQGQPSFVVGLCMDVTEKKQAEEERTKILEQLADLNRKKDEFLAMLGHELRNPLSAISNAVQLFMLQEDPRLKEWSQILERQVAHLARLLDDLLDVARVTQGKIRLKKERTSIATLIERAVHAVEPLIQEKQQSLSLSLSTTSLQVEVDPTRLEQVLINLLTNAAKYTHEKGSVSVSLQEEEGQVVIAVKDNGIGIPSHMLSKVFDLFAQSDTSLDRAQGGLGIGLTLARNLVELHGGTLTAQSEGEEKGSTFIITLSVAQGKNTSFEESNLSPIDSTLVQQGKVLIVDDNEDSALLTGEFLREVGYEVYLAHDGEAALIAAFEHRPDAIILDIGLPKIDGYEVTRRLRDTLEFAYTPIIALSGYGDEKAKSESQKAGFTSHLVKPIHYDVLLTLLSDSMVPFSRAS